MSKVDYGPGLRGVSILRLLSALEARSAALVHASAAAPQTTEQNHRTFIRQKLVVACGAVGLIPIYLATGAMSSPAGGLLLACLLLPPAALALVVRTGRLGLAQAMCAAGIAGLAIIPVLAGWPGGRGALMWLLVLPFEGVIAGGATTAVGAGVAAAAAFVTILAAAPPASLGSEFVFGCPALAYASFLAHDMGTMLRRLRGAKRRDAAEFHALTELAGDLLLHVDRAGLVTALAGPEDHMLGLTRCDLIDRGFFERLHVVDRPAFLKAVSDAVYSRVTTLVTLRLRGADATFARATAEPVFRWIELRLHDDGTHGAANVIAVLRDVTDAKRHTAAMEAGRKAAEEASLSKDHFLANVSHELRTPLNAIIGFSEMMSSPHMAPIAVDKQREYAAIIHQSGHHLLSVVNSLLDMSKIQAGRFELRPESFPLAPLIDQCCDMIKLKAEEGGVELVRAYPDALEEMVADKRACKQIVLNLLSNAVKFTPRRGRVTVGARPDGTHLLLQVTDTGIGIDPRDLGQLGDAFFQARTGVDRPFEGTGLGLSVVRGLVGLHGGTISVESAPGQGTSVTVRLPLNSERHLAPRAAATITTLPRRSRLDDIGLATNMKVRKIA